MIKICSKYLISSVAIAAIASQSLSAVMAINLDYSYDSGGFYGVAEKAVVDQVVSDVTSRLSFTGDAVTPGGSNSWSYNFNNPSTGDGVVVSNPMLAANSFTLYLGAQPLAGATLGQAGSTGWGAGGTQGWIDSIDARNTAGNFDPWAGTLSLDSEESWFTGVTWDAAAASGKNDMYSVVLHEVLHAIGFSVGNQAFAANVDAGNLNYTGASVFSLTGGEVGLHSDFSHFESGTMSEYWNGSEWVVQGAIMTPSIMVGTRKYVTELDYSIFKDFDFDVSAVPEPNTYAAFAGIFVLAVVMTKRRELK